jgi:hypothetical protein
MIRYLTITIILCFSLSAYAESGWYLLIPPTSKYNEEADFLQAMKVLDKSPLDEWNHQGSYDTASECEAVKHTFMNLGQRNYARTNKEYLDVVGAGESEIVINHKRFLVEMDNANVNSWQYSRCIKSDDPRLAQ